MGLAVRIIPTLLNRHGKLVKGRQFKADRVVGATLQAARIHQSRGVDELCILDIAATPEGRSPDFEMIEQLTAGCFMPISVGGGVKSVGDVQRLLRAGADKVVIGTWAWMSDVVRRAADMVGSQAVVVSVDVRGGVKGKICVRSGASEMGAGPSVRQCAMNIESCGAGEILLTSIDREGTMQGYDLDLISTVARSVSIPVIAHGGCGTYEHMLQAIKAGASAVAAGAMFQFTDQTPKGAAQYLAAQGIEVRL